MFAFALIFYHQMLFMLLKFSIGSLICNPTHRNANATSYAILESEVLYQFFDIVSCYHSIMTIQYRFIMALISAS
jgi:hypothetical protein